MKQIRYILLFLTVACPYAHLSAQFDDFNKHLEKSIKTSGEYYYGDGSDRDEANAQAIAVEELKLMIDEKMKAENPGMEKVLFNSSLEKSIGYVKFSSLGRFRLVAYVAKKSLVIEKNGTTMTVGAKGNPTPPVSTTPSTPVDNPQHAEEIIKELISIKNSTDAEQYLNTRKNEGKLMVGRMSTLQTAQNCYFIIIRDGAVVDVLDKGISAVRKGLLTDGQTDYTTVPEKEIYWILIF